jgi:hypothetical protein
MQGQFNLNVVDTLGIGRFMLRTLLISFVLSLVHINACALPSGFPPKLSDLVDTQPLVLNSAKGVVIRRQRIAIATDNCITLRNCQNIWIDACEFGPAGGEGVHLVGCTSVTISNCFAHEIRTGVYAVDCQGVVVHGSSFRNVKGPMPRGQMVQFDKVTGSGNRITSNTLVNEAGASNPEDGVSVYMSAGTETDPILVSGNRIIGGGPSMSGGGIMIGDSGGSHVLVRDNILIDPGQYGIAVSGGEHIQLLHNTIYARRQPFTNVGLYVWKQGAASCGDITVRRNRVKWTNKEGVRSGGWNAGNCGTVLSWDDNEWEAALDPELLVQ